MDKYNRYLLGAVKDRVTTEDNISVEIRVHNIVDEYQEEGLIVSLYREEDRSPYG